MIATLRRLLPALAVGAALLAGVASAQDASLTLQVVSVTDAGYPKAQAVVTVEDTASTSSPALTPDSVAVTLNGAPAKVLATQLASSQTTPLDVLFLVDVSGSMAGQPLTLVKGAATAFIAQLAPQDRVAVIAFSDRVHVLQDYTADHAAASAVIDRLQASGNTALYEATAGAALKAATSKASRRAIILLSDGADYGSSGTVSRQQAIDAAGKVGVPFFAIGEGTDIDRAYLQQLAAASNGRYLEAPDPRQLGDLYASIARLLRSQYVITFDASGVHAAGDVPVTVTVHNGARSATGSASYHAPPPPPATVSVDGVQPGESLTSRRTVTAQVGGGQAVSRVTFQVDGKTVAEATSPPYTYTYDPAAFGAGAHELSVTAQAASGPVTSKVSFLSTPPARAAGGGGVDPLLLVAAVVVAILLAGGVLFLALRRRRREETPPPVDVASLRTVPALPPEAAPVAPEPEPAWAPIAEPRGLLISRTGDDLGNEYVIGGSPVSIGSGERCAVRIADRGLSAVEARVWVRDGQLMLHRMMSLNAIANEGVTGGWSILEPGDTFQLGPHTFEFRLLPVPAPERDPSDIPNVLRDPDEPPRAPGSGFTAAPEPARLRLLELMPKNDVNTPPDRDERAS
ncbi:MAG: VWA domain-containing protein [Chloroflexota bacterium]|nr:VWA domain-containing protein [Chloroflexota bacterium]